MDSVKDIKGVNPDPKGHEPRQMGRMHGPTNAPPEVIRPSKYGDGQDRMGTPAGAENRDAKKLRYRDGEQHRASLRGEPIPTAPRGR
jgi:hypothetical protein